MPQAQDKVLLAHGGGGMMMKRLIEEIILPRFRNPRLDQLGDSAVLDPMPGRLAFTTDSFVLKPLFLPGGDIGRLSVCGTVNDLAASGARPLYISLSIIIEEGFPISDLARVLDSAREAANEAEVEVVAGDTKVVERGAADGLFLTTSGIGRIPDGVRVSPALARPGDKVLISGGLGDHGVAVMSARPGIQFETPVKSDMAPLGTLVEDILRAAADIHAMRDPTRGGLAAALNEIAAASRVSIIVDEAHVPVRPEVTAACDILGLDPIAVANEGKMLVICPASAEQPVIQAMRRNPLGRDAAVIGDVVGPPPGRVLMRTRTGGERIIDLPYGEQLPRIC
jgi:hydrogenase expression/formation protein HypE